MCLNQFYEMRIDSLTDTDYCSSPLKIETDKIDRYGSGWVESHNSFQKKCLINDQWPVQWVSALAKINQRCFSPCRCRWLLTVFDSTYWPKLRAILRAIQWDDKFLANQHYIHCRPPPSPRNFTATLNCPIVHNVWVPHGQCTDCKCTLAIFLGLSPKTSDEVFSSRNVPI